jgi:hypothetical protein
MRMNRRRLLEMYPEEGGADPLWYKGVSLALDDLPISSQLRFSLRRWASTWEEESDSWSEADYAPWDIEGRQLCERLNAELAPHYHVRYLE